METRFRQTNDGQYVLLCLSCVQQGEQRVSTYSIILRYDGDGRLGFERLDQPSIESSGTFGGERI